MPILRVSLGNENGKTGQFLVDNRSKSSQKPANSQVSNSLEMVSKGSESGCEACNTIRNTDYKWINVHEIGRFCSKECWNNWIRENGSRKIDPVVPEEANSKRRRVLGYRLRNEEDWLSEIKKNHKSLNPPHSSIYICKCNYAKNFRASELGLWFEESIFLEKEGII